MTGHVFARPLKNLPPKWLLAVAERMIRRLAPSMEVHLRRRKNPQALSILAATSQTVRIDKPGQEPEICSGDISEEASCFGGRFATGRMTASAR